MEDFIVFLVIVFLIILGVWFAILLIRKDGKQYPKFTSINLPHKINPSRTVDDRYGVGTFMLDIVTIGGLESSKKQYMSMKQAILTTHVFLMLILMICN